jgi:hypothetical protein
MKWSIPHSNRPFIEGNVTTREDSTMTDQENEAPVPKKKPPFWWTREDGQTDMENEGEEEAEEEEGEDAEGEEEEEKEAGVNDPRKRRQ